MILEIAEAMVSSGMKDAGYQYNDLRNMTPEIVEILTNREVIAVNQDSLGIQGTKVRDDGDIEVWTKQLKDASRAVVLFNRCQTDIKILDWLSESSLCNGIV